MLYRRDGVRCPPDMTLGIQAKEINFGFIRPENLVSESPLDAFWQTTSRLSCAFYSTIKDGLVCWTVWSAAEMVVLLEGSPISTEEMWISVRVTNSF